MGDKHPKKDAAYEIFIPIGMSLSEVRMYKPT